MALIPKYDSHENRVLWQKFLFDQGYKSVVADGVFGSQTSIATKSFQHSHGLTGDGTVGEGTLSVAKQRGFAGLTTVLPKRAPIIRLAASLVQLRKQINDRYPARDKTSDGWIGDKKHATRKSDHNPWVKADGDGVVTAIDVDEDLAPGLDAMGTVVRLCASRDPRVKYIIYEGKITVQGSQLQQWKKYTGVNAHKHHVHVSVFPDRRLFDDASDWAI